MFQAHIEKKTLSCNKCYRMFASFNELESHFYRVHAKKSSSAANNKLPSNNVEHLTAGDTKPDEKEQKSENVVVTVDVKSSRAKSKRRKAS